MGKLNDKVVVVTGSVSAIPGYDSIGSATVREALAEGAAGVVISDINDELGEAFAKSLNEQYGTGRALYVHTDVREPKDVEKLFDITEKTYGRVDAVMANAGVATAEDFDKDPEAVLKSRKFIQSINEDGVFHTALYGSRLMIKHGRLHRAGIQYSRCRRSPQGREPGHGRCANRSLQLDSIYDGQAWRRRPVEGLGSSTGGIWHSR